jgi:hypothetical protein
MNKSCKNCSFYKYCDYRCGECYDGTNFKKWWEELGAITIDDEEQIESDFEIPDVIMFEKGTERNEIWLWFDENSSEGLAKLIGLK